MTVDRLNPTAAGMNWSPLNHSASAGMESELNDAATTPHVNAPHTAIAITVRSDLRNMP
ncbi:MAG: hypothetical protein K2K72_00955 [Duncaniella sp.]|nr:hypothetical protein [Duncaniella sp.]